MASSPDSVAILVAAGSSTRMRVAGAPDGPRKPWLELAGRPLLAHALAAFDEAPSVARLVVVAHADDRAAVEELAASLSKPLTVVPGGATRAASVRAGLAAAGEAQLVAVHDAARPLVTSALVERVLARTRATGSALPGLPVVDTLQRVRDGAAVEPVPREDLIRAQTPQCFDLTRLRALVDAHADDAVTDDASLWERHLGPVALVEGEEANLKVTRPADLEQLRHHLGSEEPPVSERRIGLGFDLHRLAEGRPCVLGGIELPHPTGPVGHSDGDAVLHAITDAVLGAAGLDDLGTLFPDTDPAHAGADSAELLRLAWARVVEAGWRLDNVDCVVATEGPRIAPHRAAMRARIAELLETTPDRVNVKGKSLEGLGALAGGTGVAVQAVCQLARA